MADIPCPTCGGGGGLPNDPCGHCGGLGWINDPLVPEPQPEPRPKEPPAPLVTGASERWTGRAFMALGILVGVAVLVLIASVWWQAVSDPLRGVLEALPGISGSVATERAETGSPLVVAIVFGVIVLAGLIALWMWQRRLIARGETLLAYGAGIAQAALVILGGGLVVTLSAIAYGADLRAEDTDGVGDIAGVSAAHVGFIAVVLAGIIAIGVAITRVSSRPRAHT